MLRALRGCATLVGLLVLGVVAAAIYWNFTRPARVASPATPSGTPSNPSALDSRVGAFEQTVRSDAAAGKKVPVSFTVTQAELAARIQAALANGEVQAPVTNVQISIVPGQVVAHGQMQLGPVAAPFTLTAVPRAIDGKAVLQVQSLDFGSVPVPQSVRDRIVGAVSSDNLLGDLPLDVSSFQAQQGQLVLEGVTRPSR